LPAQAAALLGLRPELLDENVESRAADMTEPAQAIEASEGAAAIFHCANPRYDPWPELLPNMQRALIDAAIAQGAVLAASEPLYVYAAGAVTISENTPIDPPTRKGAVRLAVFRLLEEATASRGLRWVTVRASDYYGPGAEGQSAFGSERFIGPLLSGRRISFLGSPDRLHSFTYLRDFGRALALASTKPEAWGRTWIAPTAPILSIGDFASLFVDHIEAEARKHGFTRPLRRDFGVVPRSALRLIGLFDPVVREVDEMLYQWRNDYRVDGSAFTRRFGIEPTDVESGMAETAAAHFTLNPRRQ